MLVDSQGWVNRAWVVDKRRLIVFFSPFLYGAADGIRPKQSEHPWRRSFSRPPYWVSYVNVTCYVDFTYQKKETRGGGEGPRLFTAVSFRPRARLKGELARRHLIARVLFLSLKNLFPRSSISNDNEGLFCFTECPVRDLLHTWRIPCPREPWV